MIAKGQEEKGTIGVIILIHLFFHMFCFFLSRGDSQESDSVPNHNSRVVPE